MGLNDRDYAREPEPGFQIRAPQSVIGALIVANVVAWIADQLIDHHGLSRVLRLPADLFTHPWDFWKLATYGFVHSPDIKHVLFNMLGLWFFGTELESLYGKREFLRIYLIAVVGGGLVWIGSQNWLHQNTAAHLVGASAGVTCVVILFTVHFPRRMILFWGILPIPAWLLGVVLVVSDMLGSLSGDSGTAYEAHLAGAGLALAYFHFGWNFGRWWPQAVNFSAMPRRAGKPKLRIHQPPDEPLNLDAEVDRILAKISESGTDSLTSEERRTLERASARYQRRRQ